MDIYGAGLFGVGLFGAGLFGAGLFGAGLFGAGLFGAGLFGAGLFGAGLFGAGLFGKGLFGTGVGGTPRQSDVGRNGAVCRNGMPIFKQFRRQHIGEAQNLFGSFVVVKLRKGGEDQPVDDGTVD